jgi:hypothetical protein
MARSPVTYETVSEIEHLIEEAWRLNAPKRLVAEREATPPAPRSSPARRPAR